MGLSGLRSPSRPGHKRGDQYQESRPIPAEMDKSYRVGRPESHAYGKGATALSVGIPRHNATAFGGGRMSREEPAGTSHSFSPYPHGLQNLGPSQNSQTGNCGAGWANLAPAWRCHRDGNK